MKKKVLLVTILALFCLAIAATTVSAWIAGTNFYSNGTTYEKVQSRGSNFSNGIKNVNKYTYGKMQIDLEGWKKLALNIGNYQFYGRAPVTFSEPIGFDATARNMYYTTYIPGSTDTKALWIQKTTGQIKCDIVFP